MPDLLGALLQLILGFVMAVGELVHRIWSVGRSRPEDARLGESGMDRDARQSWNRLCLGCFAFLVILPMVAGLIWWWIA